KLESLPGGQTVIKILLSGERFSEKRWENFIRLSSMIVLVVKQPVPVGRKQYKLLLLHCKSSNIMIA
ncbi:hypothetical protein, partial [Escherichia coli]|uniref:hypothetical protein n=1 Tax=Escherichia coli TaxID=562 RepID=UPI001F494EF6